MADHPASTRIPRGIRWAILIGLPLIGMVIYGLIMPFMVMTMNLERRTGAFFVQVSYFGIPWQSRRPVATPTLGQPVGKVPLTAPEREIRFRQRTQRFFWSKVQAIDDDELGTWYAEAFYQLFYFANNPDPKARKLSPDEVDHLVRQRVAAWNSTELDNNPRAIAEAARRENSELLGVPVEYIFGHENAQ